MLIEPAALRDFVTELFTRAGATGAVAGEVAEHLVEANLKGHDSHGVGMIPAYVRNIKVGHLDVEAHASVIRDSGAVVLVDGHHGFGQVVGRGSDRHRHRAGQGHRRGVSRFAQCSSSGMDWQLR